MRERIWEWVLRNHPEGTYLERRHLIIRWLLFPLDTFYYFKQNQVYDVRTDVWTIHGVKYTGHMMRVLTKADGVYRFKYENNTVSITRLKDEA